MRADRTAPNGQCARKTIEILYGSVPVDAVPLTRATSKAWFGMKATLDDHEALAEQLAARFCADGLSVLRAVESDGVVEETELVVWKRGTALTPKAQEDLR